ncbi:aldehyde-activating protein [Altererythrobacter xixiisoli]|uniref:Aldehyde-activating protein n=1 Tax=Croceibacterium xixiisoli TaxID=1476466 RepID=A0A6I4TTC7_9SPHN|nr:GFA family protein [Croceibacterium xixiisoli]MXO99226.1 aldehyde-activating protein [Croceibacterium xixiisoli]
MQRTATCRCGALRAICNGEPVRISVCHCLDCQRRSGSAFSAQARFPADCVELIGEAQIYRHQGDSGAHASFHFCALCAGTIAYANATMPGLIAIPLGAFADPHFPPPQFSVYEERKHGWVTIAGDGIEHWD